jgi:hypothetical protein
MISIARNREIHEPNAAFSVIFLHPGERISAFERSNCTSADSQSSISPWCKFELGNDFLWRRFLHRECGFAISPCIQHIEAIASVTRHSIMRF